MTSNIIDLFDEEAERPFWFRYRRYSGRKGRLYRAHGRKIADALVRRYPAHFRKYIFPVIRKFITSCMPSLNELMSVQLMSVYTGKVFYTDYVYSAPAKREYKYRAKYPRISRK